MERIRLGAASPNHEAIARAAEVINAGKIAALPAEGLYGLHLRPDLPAAIERLRSLKPREASRSWIGLIDDPAALARYADPLPERAAAMAREHWPGALTLIVPSSSSVPAALRAPDGSVALRCPGSEFLRAVVRACGGLLITTSANEPGAPPPARPDDVAVAGIDLLVDGGALSGVPSTIVRVEGDHPHLIREGAVRIGEAPLDGPRTAS